MDSSFKDYVFTFIVCEGTNEEYAFRWIEENHRLIFADGYYSDNFLRAHSAASRMNLINTCLQHDFGGRVAIIYIHDSKREQWKIPKSKSIQMDERSIEIVPVITSPEIEMLIILSDDKLAKRWAKYSHRMKPSEFCKMELGCIIKDGDSFKNSFASFDDFVAACKKYRSRHKKDKKVYFLADIISDKPVLNQQN